MTTVGYGQAPAGVHEHLEIDAALPSLPQTLGGVARLAIRRHRSVELTAPAVEAALRLLEGRQFDLVIANEARALPLAHKVSKGAPIWGDMHEWAPEERTQILSWRILVAPHMRFVCRTYLPRTDAVTTVNQAIADLYDQQFGLHTEVVRNSLPDARLTPTPLAADKIRLVHSGGAVPGRNIESIIGAVKELDDRFTLDLFLVEARDGGRYLAKLKQLAGDCERITFHPPVPPSALPATLNAFDIGVYQLPPATTNQRLALPNKFFDFVQARLGMVFGPSEEIARLIRQFDLGRIATDFGAESLKAALAELTAEQVAEFKQNADRAAPLLSSDTDDAVVRGILHRLSQGTVH
ncbi:glycosyltransferase family protein [Arthrobacter sp. TMS2-4]